MSVELTNLLIPGAVGVAMAFLPLRLVGAGFALIVAAALVSLVTSGGGELPAPAHWLVLLIVASPVVLVGWLAGVCLRPLLPGDRDDSADSPGKPG